MIVSFEICIMFEVIKDVPDVDILCVVSVVVVNTATIAKKKMQMNVWLQILLKLVDITFKLLFYHTRDYHFGYVFNIIWTSTDMMALFFRAPM